MQIGSKPRAVLHNLSETQWLTDEDLKKFVTRLESSLSKGFQLMGWNGYDLELQGESQGYLEELRAALEQRLKPASLVSYTQVHDLSGYSSRIEGIGIEKPYYSPYIGKKKDDEGWFPENVLPVIAYTPEGATEPVAVPATPAVREQLREALREAESSGRAEVHLPGLPKPMSFNEAKDIEQVFDEVFKAPATPHPADPVHR